MCTTDADSPHALAPRPVTAPWLHTGPGTLYSWICAHKDGSSSEGISGSEHDAMRAVTTALKELGGQGLVQKCRLGLYQGPDARDQYAYGDVIGRARLDGTVVVWMV